MRFVSTPAGTNTATGLYALFSNTNGTDNTANGAYALSGNSGSANTAAGSYALFNNTFGSSNTATGAFALQSNTGNASSNTATGAAALFSTTSGKFNTAIGRWALETNQTGEYNTAIGYEADAGVGLINLQNTSAIGARAKVMTNNSMILGDNSVRVGIGLSGDATGPTNKLEIDENNNLPFAAGVQGTSGLTFRNLRSTSAITLSLPLSPTPPKVLSVDANGVVVLAELTGGGGSNLIPWEIGGNNNVTAANFIGTTYAIGNTTPFNFKLNNQPSGTIDPNGKVFLGYEAGRNTTAQTNTGIGYQALKTNVSGASNSATGYQSLFNNTGSNNTANGYKALFTNTVGGNNTAVGYEAMLNSANTTANTATGVWALRLNQTGSYNTSNKYDMLIPVLTKAIQEQQAMIEAQQAEIEKLKKRDAENATLRTQLEAQKAQLDKITAALQTAGIGVGN